MTAGEFFRRLFTLVVWLGPWTDEHARPGDVNRRTIRVSPRTPDGDRDPRDSFDAWLYAPDRGRIQGAWVMAPGVHFEGPRDPRMDRLCRILAASGNLVLSPFIRDYMRLLITRRAIRDFIACVDAFEHVAGFPDRCKPWLFSISFGSLLSLRAAASPECAHRVGGVISFGGYADWRAVMEFSISGHEITEHHDPLNRPVVFLNMLDDILAAADCPREHAAALTGAWLEFAQRTWSRAGRARDVDYPPVARDIADRLHERARDVFLMGCGAAPGTAELCARTLERFDGSHMDVRPHLSGLACPVHIAHGALDDVIPVTEADKLAAAMPAHVTHRTYITGLYGHTGHNGLLSIAPSLGREFVTLMRLVHALARG